MGSPRSRCSGGLPRGHDRPGKRAALSDSTQRQHAQTHAAARLTIACRSQPTNAMRKLVISLCAAGSAASAAAWSPRDIKSAVRVAWDWPSAWRGSPAAAEAPKALPEENVAAGRGRGVVQMLSGAVLWFLIGAVSSMRAASHTYFSFLYRDLLVPEDEPEPLDDLLEPDFVLPDPVPVLSPDADWVDRQSAFVRRDTARRAIYIEWLQEELAVMRMEEYDPAPTPYCKRSPYYEGPGFEVPLSDLDSDSDAD